jgi:hypothetical protein
MQQPGTVIPQSSETTHEEVGSSSLEAQQWKQQELDNISDSWRNLLGVNTIEDRRTTPASDEKPVFHIPSEPISEQAPTIDEVKDSIPFEFTKSEQETITVSENREFKLGTENQTEINFRSFNEDLPERDSTFINKQEVYETTLEFHDPSYLEDESFEDKPNKLIDFGFFTKTLFKFIKDSTPSLFSFGKKALKESKEVRSAGLDLLKNEVFFKHKVLTKEEQEKENKRKAEEKKKAAVKKDFYSTLKSQQGGQMNPEQKRALEEKLKYANSKLKMNLNFEGAIQNGALRQDLEMALEKKEKEEQEEEQKKKMREQMMARGKAKAGQKGVADMNLATENQSHWSKAVG